MWGVVMMRAIEQDSVAGNGVGSGDGANSTPEESSANNAETSSGAETGSPSGGAADGTQISRDELAEIVATAANAGTRDAIGAVGDSLTEQIEAATTGVVSVAPEQYETLTKLGATQLHVQVAGVGLASLLLGAVIAIAVTTHWRARG